MQNHRFRTLSYHPPAPLLLYDGACGFCKFWAARWQQWTGNAVHYHSAQSQARAELPLSELLQSVHYVEPDGSVSRGAAAVFRSLATVWLLSPLLWLYLKLPFFASASEAAYTVVARNRHTFSWFTRILWVSDPLPDHYGLSYVLVLRALALVYLAAFLSLWIQWDGLYGVRGILPVDKLLAWHGENGGLERFWQFPTLLWIRSDSGFVHGLFSLALVTSVLALRGLFPLVTLSACWILYLSFATVGQEFFNFQWDALLLEFGLLAILAAPLRRLDVSTRPPALAWLALKFLLFRLMFSSGLVKLLSNDPTWADWTALSHHYETQPLPLWTAWYANTLPLWFHKLSCATMFFIELIVPFFIFAPRRPRRIAAVLLLLLQLLIALTGNYNFFNLLAVALCLTLLDTPAYPQFLKNWFPTLDPEPSTLNSKPSTLNSESVSVPPSPSLPVTSNLSPLNSNLQCTTVCALPNAPEIPITQPATAHAHSWPRLATLPILILLMLLGASHMFTRFGQTWARPAPLAALDDAVAPLRPVSAYGLFAVMTTRRYEIVIEGSNDGKEWKAYEFRYKPGAPGRAPRLCAPHQPRLDWQMWFAALGSARQNPWFIEFLIKLMEGSGPVLDLLETNPFPEKPPKLIRAKLYEYKFTTPDSNGSDWWTRTELPDYLPAMPLRTRQ